MELPRSLVEAAVFFADADNAERFVSLLRWPNGVCCPSCGSSDVGRVETRRVWKCRDCKKQFSAKKGTIFEDSAIPLGKWLVALWLHANAKNGISSCELARTLGITQKSAWHMAHRIRLAMESGSFRKLSGTVESDETYVGGTDDPRRKKHQRYTGQGMSHKKPVFGMLERGSKSVRAYPVDNAKGRTLRGGIRDNVWPGTELYTDGHVSYILLRKEYIHRSVNHFQKEWAVGEIHTNGIENFWCLFKRSVKGTWVCPSDKHLARFVTDQVFRYNQRHLDDYGRFETVTKRIVGRRLTWKELVSGN